MDIISYTLGKKAGGGQPQPANLQEKEVSITQNGESTVRPDTGYDGLSKVDITANVQPNLESKNQTISENTTTTITPSEGYDGLSSVVITTDIDTGIDWSDVGYTTADPIYADYLHNKAKEVLLNWDKNNPHTFTNNTSIVSVPTLDLSQTTANSEKNMFNGCSNLVCVSNNFNATTYGYWFFECTSLRTIDISNFSVERFVIGTNGSFAHMFNGCTNLEHVDFGNFEVFDPSKTDNIYRMFYNCLNLDDDTLNDIMRLAILVGPNLDPSALKISNLGITNSNLITRMTNLSNYDDFIAAGWTLG